MTARHQIRIGNRRLARERAAIDATPAPSLGEMLQLARERKGVDLFRAERDTKIRLKYLAALEDGHFDDLPAPVYTKGFLRNYAIYLALDPEEVLQRWRDEMIKVQGRKAVQRPAVAPPPRPIATPRRGITISAGWLMALLVSAAVVGFVAYIGLQLMRFAEVVPITITDPPSLVSTVNAENIMLAGTSGPGSVITIFATGQQLTAIADETGQWSRQVPLAPGRNDFEIHGLDPVTRRSAPPVNVIVTVPLGPGSAAPTASAAPAPELRLTLFSPSDGASLESGQLTVSGSTSGGRVTIAAQPLEAPEGAIFSPAAEPSAEPGAQASPGASADPSASPAPAWPSEDVSVPAGGRFSETLELAPGEWEIVVTAYSSGLQPVSQTRNVTIEQPEQMVLVIEARGNSWLRVVADGTDVGGWGGPILSRGDSLTVTATDEIWLRAGRPGALQVTLNDVELGALGTNARPANWILRPGLEPEQTSETR